jgi:chromosome segregation ATPase
LDFAHVLICLFGTKVFYSDSDVGRFAITGRVEILEATVASLEGQLEEHSSDADNAITQWQESYNSLEVRSSELASQFAQQAEELESMVKSLEDQLEEQSSDADDAISQWQESYAALEVRCSELESQLETREAAAAEAPELEAKLVVTDDDTELLLESVKVELRPQQTNVEDLESTLLERDAELAQEREKAMAAISEWESSGRQLEGRIVILEDNLGIVSEQREKLARSLRESESGLDAQRTLYNELLSKHEATKAHLRDGRKDTAAPQDSLSKELAFMKSQLDDERETHTSTQSQLLAIQKELADFTIESEEIVNLWKGEYSVISRLL